MESEQIIIGPGSNLARLSGGHVNRPLALRGMIIDVYPYTATDEDIAVAQETLGLIPSAADGAKIERDLSNARMGVVQPLSDTLGELSLYAAEAVTQYMLSKADPSEDTDRIRQIMVTQNVQVIGIAAHCIIARLLESGVLELKKVT